MGVAQANWPIRRLNYPIKYSFHAEGLNDAPAMPMVLHRLEAIAYLHLPEALITLDLRLVGSESRLNSDAYGLFLMKEGN